MTSTDLHACIRRLTAALKYADQELCLLRTAVIGGSPDKPLTTLQVRVIEAAERRGVARHDALFRRTPVLIPFRSGR